MIEISEESLGMGDPEFHEIEDQLFDAIDRFRLSCRDQEREHLLAGPERACQERIILVDPVEAEDVDDPSVLNLDKA